MAKAQTPWFITPVSDVVSTLASAHEWCHFSSFPYFTAIQIISPVVLASFLILYEAQFHGYCATAKCTTIIDARDHRE